MFANNVSNSVTFSYLNISGIQNIYKQDTMEGLSFSQNCIIGIIETLSESDNFHCSALKNFQSIISPATRINRKGRAKGGLILLNNKEHISIDQILHKDDHSIVCMYRLSYSSLKVIVVLLYYPPDLKSKCILECLC